MLFARMDPNSRLIFCEIPPRKGSVNSKSFWYHTHLDEYGVLRKCYHRCKTLLTKWEFYAGITFSFPLEHLLWEKVWPFNLLTKWLGL